MAKYDIQTLLALSKNARIAPDKFSDQALGNNLLRQTQPSTGVLSEQSVNQSRAASNISHQSETSSSLQPEWQHPYRQPHNPPKSALVQNHLGFATFLKQHTSPKHQRVTAGGRIVPMDCDTPVPKFNLPVNNPQASHSDAKTPNDLAHYEDECASENRLIQPVGNNINPAGTARASFAPMGMTSTLSRLPILSNTFDQPVQTLEFAPGDSMTANTSSLLMQTGTPLALCGQPMSQFEHAQQHQEPYGLSLRDYAAYGTTLPETDNSLAWPTSMYPTYTSQGANITSVPNPTQPQSTLSNPGSCNNTANAAGPLSLSQFSSAYDACYPSLAAPQLGQYIDNQTPMVSEMPQRKSLDDSKKRHEYLSAQLTRLDRYMAMHTWDLDPQAKKVLVEQRKGLVRELDVLRVYREHLEVIFGGLSITNIDHQKDIAREVSILPGTYLPGNIAGGQAAQGLQSSASYSQFGGQPLSAATFSNALYVPSHEGPNSVFPLHDIERTSSGVKGIGAKNAPTNSESFEQSHKPHKQSKGKAHASTKRATQVRNPNSSSTEASVHKDLGRWASAAGHVPPEIQRLYYLIEQSSRRGEPISGLLAELSTVTQRLLKVGNEGHTKLSERASSTQASASTSNTEASAKGSSSRIKRSPRPITLKQAKRLWKSEVHLHQRSTRNCSETSFETDMENCSRVSSSYVSTTDSWTTIHKEDKRHIDSKSLTSQAHGNRQGKRFWERVPNMPTYPVAQAQAEEPKNRSTTGWNKGINPWFRPSNLPGSRRLGKVGEEDQSKVTRTPTYSPLNKNRSLAHQKTVALAVPQNVNAHAFLPSFDGAGDMLDPRAVNPKQSDNSLQNTNGQNPKQEARPWYMPKEREKPSAAAVSEFLRRIEDDERRMIRAYQVTEPTPWRLN